MAKNCLIANSRNLLKAENSYNSEKAIERYFRKTLHVECLTEFRTNFGL